MKNEKCHVCHINNCYVYGGKTAKDERTGEMPALFYVLMEFRFKTVICPACRQILGSREVHSQINAPILCRRCGIAGRYDPRKGSMVFTNQEQVRLANGVRFS